MLDIFPGSLRVLFRRKTRTVLTIIGIAVGVASVILINNIGQCGRNALTSEIDGLGIGAEHDKLAFLRGIRYAADV